MRDKRDKITCTRIIILGFFPGRNFVVFNFYDCVSFKMWNILVYYCNIRAPWYNTYFFFHFFFSTINDCFIIFIESKHGKLDSSRIGNAGLPLLLVIAVAKSLRILVLSTSQFKKSNKIRWKVETFGRLKTFYIFISTVNEQK